MSPSEPGTVAPTTYWHQLGDGRVQCDLSPRFCRLHEGQRGFCFVRARQHDQMVLITYGRSSGYCVDPIEKNVEHPGPDVPMHFTAFHPDWRMLDTPRPRQPP